MLVCMTDDLQILQTTFFIIIPFFTTVDPRIEAKKFMSSGDFPYLDDRMDVYVWVFFKLSACGLHQIHAFLSSIACDTSRPKLLIACSFIRDKKHVFLSDVFFNCFKTFFLFF